MDPQALLSGPRGRRLCLELAAQLDEQVSSGVLHLSSERETGPSITSVVLTWAGPEDDAPAPPPPARTVGELAAQLTSLAPDTLDESVLHESLVASVDAAMYWQPPDGEDHLAAQPEIAEALVPLATAVAESATAARWCAPMAKQQWVLTRHGHGAPADQEPHRDVSRWARELREAEGTARTERSRHPRRTWSGAWWSLPLGLQVTLDHVPAGLDLEEDGYGWDAARVVPVQAPERVYEITAAEDWIRLCQAHPLEVTASRRDDWALVTGRYGRWVVPDWEQVAQQWDAVHLTIAGYLESATRALDIEPGTASMIAGWAPGTSCWLDSVEPVALGTAQLWRRSDSQEEWRHTDDE